MEGQVQSDELAQSIFDDCLKLLQKLIPQNQMKITENKELQKVATSIIRNVFKCVSAKSKGVLILQCADSLQKYSEDRQFTYGAGTGEPAGQSHLSLDVNTALHLLRNVLSVPDGGIPDDLYEKLSVVICESLYHVDDHVCAKITGTVLSRMLRNVTKDVKNWHISKIWTVIQDLFDKFGQTTFRTRSIHPLSERPLMLLCGLADWMFPVDDVMDFEHPVVIQPSFWIILQYGFFHSSPLTRKRALYLLKRILDTVELQGASLQSLTLDGGGVGAAKLEPIFWWSPQHAAELGGVWQNFILLIESIAEKQVHVIRPLMPRFQSLVEGTRSRDDGPSLLHSSWIGCLAQRIASHENTHVKCWGITEMLTMDYTHHMLVNHDFQRFLCVAFVSMLTEPSVYYKRQEDPPGSCSPCGESLVTFMQRVCQTLDAKHSKQFLHAFLEGVTVEMWSGAALVHLVRALSHMPRASLIGGATLAFLRKIIVNAMSTMQTQFRGAVQCFLAETLMNLLDTAEVVPQTLFPVLIVWKSDESLRRGTKLWSNLTGWFKTVCANEKQWNSESINQYLQRGFSHITSADDCLTYIRLLLLATDSEVLQEVGNQYPIQYYLQPVTETLSHAHSRAYISIETVTKAISCLFTLLRESQIIDNYEDNDRTSVECRKLVGKCTESVMLFILRHLIQETLTLDDIDNVELYRDYISALWSHGLQDKLVFSATTQKLITSCSKLLLGNKDLTSVDSKVKSYGAMLLLGEMSEQLVRISGGERPVELYNILYDFFHFRWHVITDFPKPVIESQEEYPWGRVSSRFLGAQWRCLYLVITSSEASGPQSTEVSGPQSTEGCVPYMERCIESLDLISGAALLPLLNCMHVLLSKVTQDTAVRALELTWQRLKEDTRSPHFWETYRAFLHLTFQPITIMQEEGTKFNTFLKKCGNEIAELGEERSGMMNWFIRHLCELSSASVENLRAMINLKELLLSVVLFGPVHSRGKRFHQEVVCYISSLGDQCAINKLHDASNKDDRMVRVRMLIMLSQLKPEVQEHRVFAQAFLKHLMENQRHLVEDANYKNFPNSLHHRHKHRGITTILIMMPFVDENNLEDVFSFATDMLSEEAQPSVRLVVEWISVLLLLRYPHLRRHLWESLKRGSDKKAACLCSLHSIVMHLSKLITDPLEKTHFMQSALPSVLPWCMVYHFNTRTFATACLVTLWRQCEHSNLSDVIKQHAIVNSVVEFHVHNSSNYICKTTQKLLDNFYYILNPVTNFTVQTIFHTLPRLTNIVDEEWLPPDLFLLVDPHWSRNTRSSNHLLPLYNPSNELETCEPGTWKVKNLALDDDLFIPTGEVQKKIIPWRSMMPDQELYLEFQDDLQKKESRSQPGGLILVTSLIDKPTNLGGLCRTCEIFGVSEYVMGNMKYLNDRNFETLSVTAQKWLPITEVPPRRLREYLLEKQQVGYTLVGAEQTTNSVCLTQYAFPKKTLLLLGNEKEGIPVDLIQLIDVCVEIPQQGIIRSLNVHVSGALLIWEYTRQHMHADTS